MLRGVADAMAVGAFLLVALSLVPVDEAYYRVEYLLSRVGPLGSASQHVRSVPSTASSILMEFFTDRRVEVEGVKIDLGQSVNATEHVQNGSFHSMTLGEERSYRVYLPPGYSESSKRYPTLYLLHGMSQGHEWWTEVARIDRIATAMIASGRIRPPIVVMPNGNRVEREISTTSLYDDRCRTGLDVVARALKTVGDRFAGLRIYKVSCEGDFETYIARDVVGEIDASFRTSGERYVGGFSIGGRGAMQLALRNPDVFDGAIGLSGNYDFLRQGLRSGEIPAPRGARLFLAAGDKDQRGVYGRLNTALFHRELDRQEIDHFHCTYDGSHSSRSWVSAMPDALAYLFGDGTPDC